MLKSMYVKHKKLITYMLCSVITAVIETVIGYLLTEIICMKIVYANTISILVGMVIHYLLVSKKVFHTTYNYWTVFVYIVTFALGLCLQNFLIWICHQYVFSFMRDFLRYVFSKVVSVVVPFGVMYYLRNWLYSLKREKK